MIDYTNLIADGYIREEYRTCEIFFTPTPCGFEKPSEKLIKLQKAYNEYKKSTGDVTTFTFLHKAEFDAFGNRVDNEEFTNENMENQKIEYEKMLKNDPFIKTLTDEDLEKVQWTVISSYENCFHPKMTKRLD